MIKDSDLRFGNLLEYGDGFISVDINVLRDLNVYLLNGLKPIPLTEELLLKAGFKKNKYRMSDLIYFEKGDITIDLNPDGIFKLHIGTVFIKNIHFVHKLQNFYFEYEGSELVFSNKP